MYEARPGDTWAIISREVYGHERGAARIAAANPGVSEPLIPGTPIAIPKEQSPLERGLTLSDVEVYVDDKHVQVITSASFGYGLDALRSAEITVPNTPETRELFVPFSYPPVDVMIDGKLWLSGYALSPRVSYTADNAEISCTLVSYPHVLTGTVIPYSVFPKDYSDVSLADIVKDICGVFGVDVVVDADVGARFDRVQIDPTVEAFSALADLARQRDVLLRDEAHGSLVLGSVPSDGPTTRLSLASLPVSDMQATYSDDAAIYSVTVVTRARAKKKSSSYTAGPVVDTGPLVRRYVTERSDASTDGEIRRVADAIIARRKASAVTVDVDLVGWNFDRFFPGAFVEIDAAPLYLEGVKMQVSQVTLQATPETRAMSLTCVLPGALVGGSA